MIPNSIILKLAEQIFINHLTQKLTPLGFKYLKGKRHFKRTQGVYVQIIGFGTGQSQPIYDQDSQKLFWRFYISATIQSPKFDKWVLETFKVRSTFIHFVKTVPCIEKIDFEVLDIDKFLTPAESQKVKNYRNQPFIRPDEEERVSMQAFNNVLQEIIAAFEHLNKAPHFFEVQGRSYIDYLRLLVYEQELDHAKKAYLTQYNTLKNKIDLVGNDHQKTKKDIQELDVFAQEIESIFQIKLESPFERTLTQIDLKSEQIKLAPDLGFKEIYRFNTSLFDIVSYAINPKGEVVLLTKEGTLLKIQSSGEVTPLGHLSYEDCFRIGLSRIVVKWIEAANTFACNNYIITETDELIELALNFDKSEFEIRSLDPYVEELCFDADKKEYHLLYNAVHLNAFHIIYDQKGHIISTQNIKRRLLKLNLKRQEIIAFCPENSVDTLDFKGKIKANYKYGRGNQYMTLSPNGQMLVLHLYSTKSHLYDLNQGKKQILWAHPTFLKQYKEKFYHDATQNFGMSYCIFTPDGKYLIGGADHGKYVVWDTDTFSRHEMIPTEAAIEMFNIDDWGLTINGSSKAYFKPYTAEHENRTLFINRSFDISDTYFMDKGNYIITQIRDSLLIWNNRFENIGHVYGIGKVTFSNQYLIYHTKNELVIHQRVSDFKNDFESSVFKEKIDKAPYKSNQENDTPSPIKTQEAQMRQTELKTFIKPKTELPKTEIKKRTEIQPQQTEHVPPPKKGLLARLFKFKK